MSEQSMVLYKRGYNDAIEGAKRFLDLNIEITELEDHECPAGDFEVCTRCRRATELTREQRDIGARWANEWAIFRLKDSGTLPKQTWCECGHIGGQHGVDYPHACATGGHDGCENGCNSFRSKLLCQSEAPEDFIFCNLELGHSGPCSWESPRSKNQRG